MYRAWGKRGLDIVISAALLVVFAPLLFIIAVAIRLDSKGPVIFRQVRIGAARSLFVIYKFRTMWADAPSDIPTDRFTAPHAYITRIGRILRMTSLDELPQLINILKGDMSFVGPRPALWNQYNLVDLRVRFCADQAIPGLTGLAQIKGRDELSDECKARYDGQYAAQITFADDLRIALATIVATLRHDGYQEGGTGTEKDSTILEASSKVPPLISVVVATYRRTATLQTALQSLVAQTWRPLEVVIVDDNADATWNELVETALQEIDWGDITWHYVRNATNLGSARSRNAGIERATGEYVTFLDDDDRYLPEKVAKQWEKLYRDSAEYGLCDLALFSEAGKRLEMRRRYYIRSLTPDALLRNHMLYHMTGTDAMMFRRDYIQAIGQFPEIDVGDEFYLMTRAILGGGTFSYLPDCLVHATVHTGETGGLSSGDGKIAGECRLYESKKAYRSRLKAHEWRYVRMRHYAVLAFAELRRQNPRAFLGYALRAFLSTPWQCIRFLVSRME